MGGYTNCGDTMEYYSAIKTNKAPQYIYMNEPYKHAKWIKPDTKVHIVYDSTYNT